MACARYPDFMLMTGASELDLKFDGGYVIPDAWLVLVIFCLDFGSRVASVAFFLAGARNAK